MSLGLLVIIFVILCMGMYEELPSIKTTFTRADSIPAPDMKFSFDKHFTMVCSIHNNDGTIQNSNECGQYITQAKYNDTYVGDFSPQGDLNFGGAGINHIMIYLNSGESFNGSVVEMQAYDSEYSPYRGHFTFNKPTIDYDPFVQEIHSKNVYHLTNANSSQPLYNWKFSRYLRKTMDKSVLSYIGFRPNYIERPYIESSIQFIPFSGISNSIAIKLVAQSHTVIMETEQRSRTIGTIIGTMGGAWSAVLSFYVFLFGSDLVSSWGLAQKLLKSKPRLKDPELDEDNEDNEKEGGRNDLTDDLKKLIRKLEEHRMFYEEYVITIPSEKTTNS